MFSRVLGDGVVLSATVLFDYPTVSQLAAHIGSLLGWEEPVEAHAAQLAVSQGDVSVQESLIAQRRWHRQWAEIVRQ